MRRRTCLQLLLLLVAEAAVGAPIDTARDIHLPASSLQQALDGLSRATQLQIMYDAAILRGYSTPGLDGVMTPSQALGKLLANTSVTFEFTVDDAVALHKKAPLQADPIPPSVQPQTITITSQRSEQNRESSVAALTPMRPELLAPGSFQPLNNERLQDQQAGRLEDVLEDVSSVETAPDGQSAVGFNIRGFPTYQYYVDGVRVSPDLHRDGFRDLANVERIDVIKGPASTLYGRTGPGGLINVNTKQPLSTDYLALAQQYGSFDHRRTLVDAGGPISLGDTVKYRFNAAYESGGSFRERAGSHRILVSPVVAWSIAPGSEVTAYLELLRSDDPMDSGLPLIGRTLAPVPIRRRVEDGGQVRTRDLRTGLRGWHAFSDDWKVSFHLDGRWLQTPQSPQRALAQDLLDPADCNHTRCSVDRILFSVPVSTGHTYFASADVEGAWLNHSLVVGAEYFDVMGENMLLYSNDADTIDLFQPHHQPVSASVLQHPDGAFDTTSLEQWNGIYAHDRIAITDQLGLMLGARYDHVREFLRTTVGVPLTDSITQVRWDSAFKRRAALVWQPLSAASLYAKYTENFGISTGLYGDGLGGQRTLLPPQSAHEWEVGLESRLLSIAWYDLTAGIARSQGLELEVHGDLNRHLRLTANYAYTNPEFLPGAARHGGSLWLTYRASAFKFGFGMVARSQREGDNTNDYSLPGFTRMKTFAGYRWPAFGRQLTVQLNVDNLLDTRYFESVGDKHSVMPGCPRRWLLSLGADL